MKSIAILTDIYFPHPMAGGICAHQLAKGLEKQGYSVHVICLRRKGEAREEFFEGLYIHRIKMPLVYRIRDFSERIRNRFFSKMVYKTAIFINRFFKIILLRWYPLMSPLQVLHYFKEAKRLGIDCVIGEYFSLESSLAAVLIKKYCGKTAILYNVDSLSNADPAVGLHLDYVRKKGYEWEQFLFSLADRVIVMKSHEAHYNSSLFDFCRDKFSIADLPILNLSSSGMTKQEENTERHKKYIHWMYAGSLSFSQRNPEYLLQIMKNLKLPVHLDLFSKGDCEGLIDTYLKNHTLDVLQHGHIAKERLEAYYRNADFLISIGNLSGTFLPSKTIDYIAHRKPIIHFQYQVDDASILYLKKYKHALVIDIHDCLEKNVDKIEKFMMRYKNDTIVIEVEEIMRKFKENTPEFSADIVHRELEEK